MSSPATMPQIAPAAITQMKVKPLPVLDRGTACLRSSFALASGTLAQGACEERAA